MCTHFYKVLWLGRETCDITWEPAENIPLQLIHVFEKGIQSAVVDDVSPTDLGQCSHTLCYPRKRPSSDHPRVATHTVIANNEEWVKSIIYCMHISK